MMFGFLLALRESTRGRSEGAWSDKQLGAGEAPSLPDLPALPALPLLV
jgi:hypothetical protein